MKIWRHRALRRLLLAALCAAAPVPAFAAEVSLAQARELERLLAELNFDPGEVDGVIDGRTRTAIELYQAFAALPVDGAPSAALLAELRQVAQAFADMKAAQAPVAAEAPAPTAPGVAPTQVAEPVLPQHTVSGTTAVAPEPPETEVAQGPQAAEPEPEPAAVSEAPVPEKSLAEPEPVSEPPAAENRVAEAAADAQAATEKPLAEADAEAENRLAEPAADPEAAAEKPVAEAEPGVVAGSEAGAQDAQAPASGAPAERPAVSSDPQAAQVSAEPEPAPVAEAGAGSQEAMASVSGAPEPNRDVAAEPEPAPAEPAKTDKARFDLDNMIARLVQNDGAAAGVAEDRPDRDLVLALQRHLARIGLDPGPLDGRVGARTTQAIESYQRAGGLAVDGRPSQELLDRLERERPGEASPGGEATDDQASQAVPGPPGETKFELRNAETAAKFPAASVAAGVRAGDGYGAFKKGYAAAEVGDYDLAIEFYTRAIEGGDLALAHLAAAFYNRANARSYKGAVEFAIADYGSAIVNNPEFPDAYYNRGFALRANGQRTRALADFMRARALGLQRLGVRSPDAPPPRP
ncbi:MAG: peptidoglycan-binding protein [Kiloniellales bacterium]